MIRVCIYAGHRWPIHDCGQVVLSLGVLQVYPVRGVVPDWQPAVLHRRQGLLLPPMSRADCGSEPTGAGAIGSRSHAKLPQVDHLQEPDVVRREDTNADTAARDPGVDRCANGGRRTGRIHVALCQGDRLGRRRSGRVREEGRQEGGLPQEEGRQETQLEAPVL